MPELPHIDASSLRAERRRPVAAAAPPLGVRHLLLWFSCCAVYLAVVQGMAEQRPGVVGVLVASVFSLGYGAAWAGLAIFVARRLSSKIYPIEPGEWLLAVLGARMAVETAAAAAPDWLIASPKGVTAAASCFLLAMPLLSRTLPALWKAVTAAMLLLYALPLAAVALRDILGLSLGPLANLAAWLDHARTPALLALLALAAARDLWRRRRYGWLHGAGVAAWMWVLTVELIVKR